MDRLASGFNCTIRFCSYSIIVWRLGGPYDFKGGISGHSPRNFGVDVKHPRLRPRRVWRSIWRNIMTLLVWYVKRRNAFLAPRLRSDHAKCVLTLYSSTWRSWSWNGGTANFRHGMISLWRCDRNNLTRFTRTLLSRFVHRCCDLWLNWLGYKCHTYTPVKSTLPLSRVTNRSAQMPNTFSANQ